jgi:excisionase family DNA binding protein
LTEADAADQRRSTVPKKPSGEFYTFDEVLRQLSIDEQKLKRLVSEGEIRAFREGDEMKFKKSDIDSLDILATEDSETREVDLSAGGGDASETLTDDLIFDEGDELDLSADDAGMATAEITSQDTFVDEGGEPVGMSTEPLEFTDEPFDEDVDLTEEAPVMDVAPTSRPRTQRRAAAAYQPAPKGGDVLFSVILIVTLLFMIYAGFVMYSTRSKGGVNNLSGSAVGIFYKKTTLGEGGKTNFDTWIKPEIQAGAQK